LHIGIFFSFLIKLKFQVEQASERMRQWTGQEMDDSTS